MIFIFQVFTIFVFSQSFAEDPLAGDFKQGTVQVDKKKDKESSEEEESSSARFGPRLAVTAFDKEEGFQLSEKATQHLRVSFRQISGSGPWVVPKEALIHIKQSTGIYRRYNKWITFVIVKVISRDGSQAKISSADLESGDEVAIKGGQFLRLAEADLNSNTVDGCAN